MEHRWGERHRVELLVRVVVSAGVAMWGRTRDLSVTGVFIETAHALPVGALISVEPVTRTAHWPQGPLTGSIVRTTARGAGVEWCEPWDTLPEVFASYRSLPDMHPVGVNLHPH